MTSSASAVELPRRFASLVKIEHTLFALPFAYVGAFLNLFNMIPVMPFDGGRIAGALSPVLWVLGFVIFLVLALTLHISLFMVILFAAFALPSAIAGWRGHVDPRFAAMTSAAKIRVGAWYLATLAALFYLMTVTHAAGMPSTHA